MARESTQNEQLNNSGLFEGKTVANLEFRIGSLSVRFWRFSRYHQMVKEHLDHCVFRGISLAAKSHLKLHGQGLVS